MIIWPYTLLTKFLLCFLLIIFNSCSGSRDLFEMVKLTNALNALRCVIMGAPGAGKGSISERIVRDFNFKYLATGDFLRKNIQQKTSIGMKANNYISKGLLVPDNVVNQLVFEELQKLKDSNWLLDGFPRTVPQAEYLSKHIELKCVINLNVPFEVIIERLKHRWVHTASGRVYNTEFNPPKVEGIDDVTGEPLIQREDDKPETVLKRLKIYEGSTTPLVDYYDKQGLLREFKGNSTNEIWPRIKIYLESLQQLK